MTYMSVHSLNINNINNRCYSVSYMQSLNNKILSLFFAQSSSMQPVTSSIKHVVAEALVGKCIWKKQSTNVSCILVCISCPSIKCILYVEKTHRFFKVPCWINQMFYKKRKLSRLDFYISPSPLLFFPPLPCLSFHPHSSPAVCTVVY